MRYSLPLRIVSAAALVFLAASPLTLLASPAPGPVTEQARATLAGGDLMPKFFAWLGGTQPQSGCGMDPSGGQCGSNGGTQPPPPKPPRSHRTGCAGPGGACAHRSR
jgi:hypothetical protein